jgi:phosphoglycerol transferase MdoB-like AlkP superfamily enzyme
MTVDVTAAERFVFENARLLDRHRLGALLHDGPVEGRAGRLPQSLPIAIATAVFYFVYRFVEDYLLTPKIMARTVQVPGLLTVIATLIGGTLFGIIGALIAIPVAATIKLLLEETTLRQLETR